LGDEIMALIENDLIRGRIDKVAIAIERLRTFEPSEGYYLAYSGGKDSDTLLALAKMSGVKFDAHYNLTTVDPPELVRHIMKHPEVIIERPEMNMWQLIQKKGMLPTRLMRFCCDVLKERGGAGRFVLTGIRAEESSRRAKRQMMHVCFKDKKKHYLHPIIDWKFNDIWEFIKTNEIEYCTLYDEGWKRLGCVMCPFSNTKKEMKRWPKIAAQYKRALYKAWDKERAGVRFKSPEDMWDWWISGKGLKTEERGLFV
jgi:phosphoadenosine phosphosulfate reductase